MRKLHFQGHLLAQLNTMECFHSMNLGNICSLATYTAIKQCFSDQAVLKVMFTLSAFQ